MNRTILVFVALLCVPIITARAADAVPHSEIELAEVICLATANSFVFSQNAALAAACEKIRVAWMTSVATSAGKHDGSGTEFIESVAKKLPGKP